MKMLAGGLVRVDSTYPGGATTFPATTADGATVHVSRGTLGLVVLRAVNRDGNDLLVLIGGDSPQVLWFREEDLTLLE